MIHDDVPSETTARRSVEEIQPLPKAQYKVKSITSRAKGKVTIYTDSPMKVALEVE